MKTLLRIDASVRIKGSNSRALADYFQTKWLCTNPEGTVIQRCLAKEPVPHIANETVEAFHLINEQSKERTLSDVLIDELKKADHVLISSPLYNLALPSTLKAYFDHIVRPGTTFEALANGYQGLLKDKEATLITTRGGASSPEYIDDYQTKYLLAILSFIGINAVNVVALENTALDENAVEKLISHAKKQIDSIFDQGDYPTWLGEFSEDDKAAIGHLRLAQASAIVKGDASAYSELCTNDILLLIPSHDVISGRSNFLEAEETLFRSANFASFKKLPLRIERNGKLAIEVGRQEVVMHKHSDTGDVFATHQKYTHVFRLTEEGWRFALLMSNSRE